jgi:hypothetical protein
MAMRDTAGEATFHVYGEACDASLINSLVADAQYPVRFGFSSKAINVDCATVDSFAAEREVKRIDLLKIDTEGTELQVLRGAEMMLRSGRVRFVYLEFNSLLPKPDSTGGALLPIAEYLDRFEFEYMITYTDFVMQDRQMHVCANALFACPPKT